MGAHVEMSQWHLCTIHTDRVKDGWGGEGAERFLDRIADLDLLESKEKEKG